MLELKQVLSGKIVVLFFVCLFLIWKSKWNFKKDLEDTDSLHIGLFSWPSILNFQLTSKHLHLKFLKAPSWLPGVKPVLLSTTWMKQRYDETICSSILSHSALFLFHLWLAPVVKKKRIKICGMCTTLENSLAVPQNNRHRANAYGNIWRSTKCENQRLFIQNLVYQWSQLPSLVFWQTQMKAEKCESFIGEKTALTSSCWPGEAAGRITRSLASSKSALEGT